MRRSSVVPALSLSLFVVACGKKETPAPPPAATSASVVAAPASASAAPKPAAGPHLVRAIPASVSASSEYDKPGEKHLASMAFDGDPSTTWSESVDGPGKDQWLEAKLPAKRKIRKLRIVTGFDEASEKYGNLFDANAHLKSVKVSFDGGAPIVQGVGAADHAVVLDGLDVEAQTIRVTADDVYPGAKWQDLCVPEIEIWTEDQAAPAGPVAPADLADAVKKLDDGAWKASSPEPTSFLASLGVPASVLKPYAYSRVDEARTYRAQLDADPGEESVVLVTLFNQAEVPHKTFEHAFVVVVDDDAHGRAILGTRDVLTFRCLDPEERGKTPDAGRPAPIGNVTVKLAPVHAAAFSDVLVEWRSTTACDDVVKGNVGALLLTAERGMVETLYAFRDTSEQPRTAADGDGEAGAASGKNARSFHLDGQPPKLVQLLDGANIVHKATFDAASFRYR